MAQTKDSAYRLRKNWRENRFVGAFGFGSVSAIRASSVGAPLAAPLRSRAFILARLTNAQRFGLKIGPSHPDAGRAGPRKGLLRNRLSRGSPSLAGRISKVHVATRRTASASSPATPAPTPGVRANARRFSGGRAGLQRLCGNDRVFVGRGFSRDIKPLRIRPALAAEVLALEFSRRLFRPAKARTKRRP